MTRTGRAFAVVVLVVSAMLLSVGIDHRAALSPTAAASTYTDAYGCADSTAVDATPVSANRLRLAVAPDLSPSCVLAPVSALSRRPIVAAGVFPGSPPRRSVVLQV